MTRPELKTFNDLKGKTMAVTTIGGNQQLAGFHMLRKGGIDPTKEITSIVSGDVPAQLQAQISGLVQITVLSPPTVFVARDRYKLNLLASTSDEYVNFISGLIVSDKALQEKPAIIKTRRCGLWQRQTAISKPTRMLRRRYLRSISTSVNKSRLKPTASAALPLHGTASPPTKKLKKT